MIVMSCLATLFAAAGFPSACAQQLTNPFAGGVPGAPGPYGSPSGAMHHLMQLPQTLEPSYGGIFAPDHLHRGYASNAAIAADSGERPEAPETPEPDHSVWEALFVACSAGSFLGAFTVLTTTGVAAGVGAGAAVAPVFTAGILTASAMGCGLGASTAAVSVGAASVWQRITR